MGKIIGKNLIRMLKFMEAIYVPLRRKYFRFLPPSPLASFPLIKKQLFSAKTNLIKPLFNNIIQEELDWYNMKHYELKDSQEAIDVAYLCKFILEKENIEGDILELGVEFAGLTIIITDFLKRIGSKKHVYGCDTFDGFPYDDLHGKEKRGGSKGLDYESAIAKIKKYNAHNVTLLKGMFEETLHQKLGDKKFSIIFVDCNLYDSTKYALEFSYPRLSDGGIIAFDDYEEEIKGKPYFGETVAANEFCDRYGLTIKLHPIPHIEK